MPNLTENLTGKFLTATPGGGGSVRFCGGKSDAFLKRKK
jgi:hypothetical protein